MDEKPRRTWLRFSLRTLFVVVTVIALLCARWGFRARQEFAAAAAIERTGGIAAYDNGPLPCDWQNSLFRSITYVSFNGVRAEPALVAQLAKLSRLEEIDLSYTGATDEALTALAGCRNLKGIDLRGAAITDDGLRHLGSIHSLEWLDLSETKIGDAGVAHLAGLPKLSSLILSFTRVSNDCLPSIGAMPALESVRLDHSRITLDGETLIPLLPQVRCFDWGP